MPNNDLATSNSIYIVSITRLPKIILNNPLPTFPQVKNCNVTRQSVSLFDPDEMAIKVSSFYIVTAKKIPPLQYLYINQKLTKIIPNNPLTTYLSSSEKL